MDKRHDGISRLRVYWRVTVLINMSYFGYPIFGLVTGDYTTLERVLGAAGLAAFVALYVPVAFTGRFRPDGSPDPVVRIVACTLLGIALTVAFGEFWAGLITYAVYLAGAAIRRSAGFCTALVATGAALEAVICWLALGPLAALWGMYALIVGLYAVAFGWLVSTYRELDRARSELARLAVADERLRFARDLHDLLGHSLSMIAIKSELAARLIHRDPDRACAEVRDIESVSREALAEVRDAVTGYRGSVDLAAELRRAGSALAVAGVTAEIDDPNGPLPPDVEALLAWTVREGATNIVRHAKAGHASIRLRTGGGRAEVELVDDGAGPPAGPISDGNGLGGLAERVAAVAGSFEAGEAPGGGFRLAVRVPR